METGDFRTAAAQWNSAAESFEKSRQVPQRIDALAGLAAADEGLGQYQAAVDTYRQAIDAARPLGDGRRVLLLEIRAAEACTLARTGGMGESLFDVAQNYLDDVSRAPEASSDPEVISALNSAKGNLALASGRPAEALRMYRDVYGAAEKAGDHASAARAAANAGVAALAAARDASDALANGLVSRRRVKEVQEQRADHISQGREMAKAAQSAAEDLPENHAKASLLLTVGQAEEGFAEFDPPDAALRKSAYDAYQKSMLLGQKDKDLPTQSFALGFTGRLYEADHRWDEALRLTRRAVFLAQQAQRPDILYRWQWQIGRLLHATGHDEDALAAYTRAVASLDRIRSDIAAGGGNAPGGSSFRGAAEGVFYEMADLLLRRADGENTDAARQSDLASARETIERLKFAQIEDYFQERCNRLLASKQTAVEQIAPTTAVVYLIPLKDRTEILVGVSSKTGSGFHIDAYTAPVPQAELIATVRRFRLDLEDSATNLYRQEAGKLYDWLMRPIEPKVRQQKVDTLVFVPDGALRTIPMSALYDAQDQTFLIQKYAVAVSPGLTLTEPKPLGATEVKMLANGLSVPREGFAALQYVPGELRTLQTLYGGTTLLNGDFRVNNFDTQMQQNEYSIVHIASHGKFGGDARDTFVLAYDKPMDLDHLQMLIEPSKFRGRPVELLTLSACETAAGDDRAALGLAGVALKAGARSAVATLWSVNDEAASLLVAEFYKQLKEHPERSKAQALQAAQRKLIENPTDERYGHPEYWAPFLIVGNWL